MACQILDDQDGAPARTGVGGLRRGLPLRRLRRPGFIAAREGDLDREH